MSRPILESFTCGFFFFVLIYFARCFNFINRFKCRTPIHFFDHKNILLCLKTGSAKKVFTKEYLVFIYDLILL